MIGRLNHVAIVVADLTAATATYRDALGARVSAPRDLPEHGVTTVFVELPVRMKPDFKHRPLAGWRFPEKIGPETDPRPIGSNQPLRDTQRDELG